MYTRTRRPRIAAAILALLAVVASGLIATSPAAAVSDVQVTVYLPDGTTPAANTDVYLFDNATNELYDGTTDPSGVIQFAGIEPGLYEVGPYDFDGPYIWDDDLIQVDDNTPVVATATLRDKPKFIGSVPLDALDATEGPTYATVYGLLNSTWQALTARTPVDADGTFTILGGFDSQLDLTVQIEVPGTVAYATSYYGGATDLASASTLSGGLAGTTVDFGEIDLVETWFITGLVRDDTHAPVDGASVVVTDMQTGEDYTVVTAGDGTFRADPVYTGNSTYFDIVASKGGFGATTLALGPTLDATTRSANVTIDLLRQKQGVSGNGVVLLNSTLVPTSFATDLYVSDGHSTAATFNPVPIDSTSGPFFSFSDLDDGIYRLGFTNLQGYGMPWSTYWLNGSSVTPTGPGGNCYIEFEITAGQPDLEFENIVFDSTVTRDSCENQAWVAQDDRTFYGQLDTSDFDSEVRVGLYSLDDDAIVSEALVNPTNWGFSLRIPHNQTDFLVVIETAGVDPYLTTVVGSTESVWIGENDRYGIDGFVVDPTQDYNVGLIAPLPGHVFTGTVRSADGSPVGDACVSAEDANDFTRGDCTASNADGSYALKVPLGDDWILGASAIGFNTQYWDHEQDFIDATPVSSTGQVIDPGYDFELVGDPASIQIVIGEISSGNADVIVHIYRPSGSAWVESGTVHLTGSNAMATLTEADFGAAPSALRFRFEVPGEGWVQLQGYFAVSLANISNFPTTLETKTCFVDTGVVRDGPPWIVFGGYDLTDKGSCAAEPVSPVTPTTPAAPGKPRTGTGSTTTDTAAEEVAPTSTPTPTPSPSASEAEEEPAATPAPEVTTASGPDLAWLFWVAGVLLVLILGGGAVVIFRRR